MHTFTPQQLSGGQRYGNKTKIGNWQEELCLEGAKKKERDKSRHGRFEEKLRQCTAPIEQVRCKDGVLHYGEPLSLLHMQTNGTLACDPFESAQNDSSEFVASVCRANTPLARNSFVIRPIGAERRPGSGGSQEGADDIVRWGEPFQVSLCPSLVEGAMRMKNGGSKGDADDCSAGQRKSLYLASRRTALSCRQLIYLTHDGSSYDTHWAAHIPAKSKNAGLARFVNTGAPILLGEPFVLQHCATKELLSADEKCPVTTDFGSEYEVCVCTKFTCGRVGLLRDEFKGTKTSATNSRPEQLQNVWCATILPHINDGNKDCSATPTPEGVISKIWDILRTQGLFSFRFLSRYLLSAALENGGNLLAKSSAHWILTECGVRLDEGQFEMLTNLCKTDAAVTEETIDVNSLCNVLRGEMEAARKQIIVEKYARLGSVDESTLKSAWDSLCRSDILFKSIGEVDFIDFWDWSGEGIITREAFFDFHVDLSAEIQSDSVFAEIMDLFWDD